MNARPLRVLFCTWDYYPHPAGGAERQARLQAEELVRRGHHVSVVCQRFPRSRTRRVSGIHVRRLPRIDRPRLGLSSYCAALTVYLAAVARRFDLLHVHIAAPYADVAVAAGLVFNRPVYLKLAVGGAASEVHRRGAFPRSLRRLVFRHATRVQALTGEIEGDLLGIGVASDRIVRIRNGVDLRAFRPAEAADTHSLRHRLGLPRDDVIVLYAGRFERQKGLDALLEAWRLAHRPGATLVVVGRRWPVESLDPLPATQRTVHVGFTNDVLSYMRAADVLAVPSRGDGLSNVLLEGAACGLPIVATRLPAAEAVLEDGVNGLLVPPGDPSALAGAVARMIEDAALRARLGAAARERAAAFSIEAVVDEIETVYRTLVR
jgi:glycosyltransferase involved in cell wall biosynthesis